MQQSRIWLDYILSIWFSPKDSQNQRQPLIWVFNYRLKLGTRYLGITIARGYQTWVLNLIRFLGHNVNSSLDPISGHINVIQYIMINFFQSNIIFDSIERATLNLHHSFIMFNIFLHGISNIFIILSFNLNFPISKYDLKWCYLHLKNKSCIKQIKC